MLTELHIANIVLIDSVVIDFSSGLCVLTGETGAGKSIMLDALGLVLGNRADTGLIRKGQEQAQVSATFDISAHEEARKELEALGLAVENELIIRRSLSADGKGKCFINDAPVSAAALKQLAGCLVEIHGQHDQRGLFDTGNHRRILDAFGAHHEALAKVQGAYAALQEAKARYASVQEAIEKARKEEEYLKHIVADLGALKPEAGEEEALSDKRNRMMQSEKLFGVLNEALGDLAKGEGVVATLRSVQRGLMRSSVAQTPAFEPVIEMLDKAADMAGEAEVVLERMGKEAEYDPAVLEEMEERLFAIRAAARKYHVSADELPDVLVSAREALKQLSQDEASLRAAESAVSAAKKTYMEVAQALHAVRVKAAAKLEKAVLKELAPLKMEHTAFRVVVEPVDEADWSRHGADMIAMQVATNVTAGTQPSFAALQKIASGGELSRFMLALKVALSGVKSTPTMIFDEIDAGTGGAVADAIGKRLAALGQTAQVMVVTHLPQVAARGSQHFVVSKAAKGKQVTTKIELLNADDRREELARMLAGEKITQEARKAADKLLEHAA